MHHKVSVVMLIVLRTEKIARDECTFAFEKECLPLNKQKCKNFPEYICDVVNVTKIQNQCHTSEEEQVRVEHKVCSRYIPYCIVLSVTR